MNRKQVIETLKMENELICFNPLTGEEIPLEYVNDLKSITQGAGFFNREFNSYEEAPQYIQEKLIAKATKA